LARGRGFWLLEHGRRLYANVGKTDCPHRSAKR